MEKPKCTGLNCPVQYNYANPETCQEPEKCPYATFPQTNADRIRAMTDEELAKILNGGCPPGAKCYGRCGTCWLEWLRSPVEDGKE